MNLSVKNKTLIFIVLIFLINLIIFAYIFYTNLQKELKEIKDFNFNKIKSSYEKNLQMQYKDFFVNKTNELLTDEIIYLIENRDEKELHKKILPTFNALKNEKLLEKFYIHLNDETTLLKIQNSKLYETNTSKIKDSSKLIHKNKTTLFSYNDEFSEIYFSVIVPIFKENTYIGAFEYNCNPKAILDFVTNFNNISGLMTFDNINQQSKIQFLQIKDELYSPFLDDIKNLKKSSDIYILKDTKLIGIYSFELKNLENHKIGSFILFNNLSKYQENFKKTMKEFVIIGLSSLIILLFVINIGFNALITKLQISYNKIKEFTNIIDENVITINTNLKGEISYASEAYCKISNYHKNELVNKNANISTLNDGIEISFIEIIKSINLNETWVGETKNYKKDGTNFWLKTTIIPILDKKNSITSYTLISQDISDKKIIEELSITDALTNIYNRRYFNEIVPKIIESSKRNNDLVSFLLLDIDFFKLYNDNYGHQMGDDVLFKVANYLKNNLKRADDMIFRVGGEEFVIIYKSLDKNKSLLFANELKNAVENLNIIHEYSKVSNYITISLGLVCKYANDIKSLDEIYKEADDLLYDAKKQGKNQVKSNISSLKE